MDLLNSLFKKSKEEVQKEAYERYKNTPENMSNWLSKVISAKSIHSSTIYIPNTLIVFLKLEEFALLTENKKEDSILKLSEILKEKVHSFQKGKPLFMKTGVFSNKFNFENCYCKDRDHLGEKLYDMYYASMVNGANETTEVVFREYLENHENRKTIYNGMPLHTEFRVFYDFDNKKVLGVSNYWHPAVMTKDALKEDYENYESTKDLIQSEFDKHKKKVCEEVCNMMEEVEGISGKWSIDIMKNGEKFWMIDMAQMGRSALVEYMETIK